MRRNWAARLGFDGCRSGLQSALAGLEAALGLIDDVDAALAAHNPIVAVPAT
jgi:hypothetical protein